MKVLLLYASYGDGHRQVAAALEQAFASRGTDVVKVDLYAKAHPCLNAISRYCYLKSFAFGSRLYGWTYYATRDLPGRLRPLFMFGLRKLRQLVEAESPDAVISTFPFSALSMLGSVPLFTVITDFALHDLWVHPAVNGIFVATEDLKEGLLRKGYHPERIHVSGIPVRPSFRLPVEQASNPLASSQKTILVMAGAYGVSTDIRKLVRGLRQNGPYQLFVVCGRNERLREMLEAECSGCPDVRIFGYVDRIAELMAVSDCIVTKAGGITLSEAIAMELPVLLFRPVPGQEKENAAYLAGKGAALVTERVDELVECTGRLLRDERQLGQMKSAIRKLRTIAPADRIVSDILGELRKQEGKGSQLRALRIDPSIKGASHLL